MTILQSIDYRKLERSSTVGNEIYTKLILSFDECAMLVVVSHRYDFEFSITAAERKCRTEDSTHKQKIETIDNQKSSKLISKLL